MIKKQQKWIALLVTLTFAWLLQVSTMPLAAASTTEQVSSASAEQAPSFVEQESASGYHAKKKSIVPIILIGVGVVAVAAVLFLVVLKTKYDFRGTWKVTATWTGHPAADFTIVASGATKDSGTFYEGTTPGTWTASGKDVVFTYSVFSMVFTGKFTSKDALSGTMTSAIPGYATGTFTAVRTASATAIVNFGPGGTGKEIK